MWHVGSVSWTNLNRAPAPGLGILATGQGKSPDSLVCSVWCCMGTFRESHTTLPTPTHTHHYWGSLQLQFLCGNAALLAGLTQSLSQSLSSWRCTSVLSFWAAFPGLCPRSSPSPAYADQSENAHLWPTSGGEDGSRSHGPMF